MVEIFTAVGQLVCLVGGLLVALAILGFISWIAFIVWIRFTKQYKHYMLFKRNKAYWDHQYREAIRKAGTRK